MANSIISNLFPLLFLQLSIFIARKKHYLYTAYILLHAHQLIDKA